MDISRALRLPILPRQVVSFTGSGGKTTAVFKLARELTGRGPVIVTSTSHLGVWQISLADRHVVAIHPDELRFPADGVILVTGEIEDDRTQPINDIILGWLRADSKQHGIPLLIEADGSRRKPLKAPTAHEPPIPEFTDLVVHVTGLSALGKPLTEEHVHRAEIFSQLSGLPLGSPVTPQAIVEVLTHPQGGLKNIPPQARRIALLNQADTPELQSVGGSMARELLGHFDSIVVGSLQNSTLQTFEHAEGLE
jgi:molybdenum cofactor cytidylyltransferase